MKLREFRGALAASPGSVVRFELPGGDLIPVHAHVSEVARVEKHFVDCGGVRRLERFCRLQAWVAADTHHRLDAAKLLRILDAAAPLLGCDDPEVDVEHEAGVLTQMPVVSVAARPGELVFRLARRHAECLAEDQCQRPAPLSQAIRFAPKARNP